jgi:hypothetical protein
LILPLNSGKGSNGSCRENILEGYAAYSLNLSVRGSDFFAVRSNWVISPILLSGLFERNFTENNGSK